MCNNVRKQFFYHFKLKSSSPPTLLTVKMCIKYDAKKQKKRNNKED